MKTNPIFMTLAFAMLLTVACKRDNPTHETGFTPDVWGENEYFEASWDDTEKKVVRTRKTAETEPVAVTDADADVTWDAGWYTVSGNVTISGKVSSNVATHLILQDGATLTINGDITDIESFYIYGQAEGTGKLNVTTGPADNAIFVFSNLEIHGGEITAQVTAQSGFQAVWASGIRMFGGKLTATSAGMDGIGFGNNHFTVCGGEVVATSEYQGYGGIVNGGPTMDQVLRLYGGKVTATGGGYKDDDFKGAGLYCLIKSHTPGIKFYFSDDNTTWDEGTSYSTSTAAPANRYAKAE